MSRYTTSPFWYLLVLFNGFVNAQQTDSVYCYGTNDTVLTIKDNAADGSWSREQEYFWDGHAWVGISQQTDLYDTAGNLLIGTSYNWIKASWQEDEQETYTYDSCNRQLLYMKYRWDWDDEVWTAHNMVTSEYTDTTVRVDIARYRQTDQWIDEWKEIHTLNVNGKTTQITHYLPYQDDWMEWWLKSYTYDTSGKLTDYTHADWDYDNEIWIDREKETTQYDSLGNAVSLASFQKTNGLWRGEEQYLYTYNANGLLITEERHVWITQYNEWFPDFRKTFGYDQHGLQTMANRFVWDGYEWLTNPPRFCGYTNPLDAAGIAEQHDQSSKKFTAFPNPANSIVYFSTLLPNRSAGLFNAQGMLLQTCGWQNEALASFNLSILPSGVYVLKQGCASVKFIKF